MTHRAVCLEQHRAARRGGARLFLAADDADVADDVGDLRRIEDAVAAEGGHLAAARRVVVGIPYAVGDRIVDAGNTAAPHPVVVGTAETVVWHPRPTRPRALDTMNTPRPRPNPHP